MTTQDTIHDLADRLIRAWEATSGKPACEDLLVCLKAIQHAGAIRRVGQLHEPGDGDEQVGVACADEGGIAKSDSWVDYPHLQKLVEVAQGTLYALLDAYVDLPPFDGDLDELFTMVLLAVPIRATIDQLIRDGVRNRKVQDS